MIQRYFEFLKELASTNPLVKEFRLIREFCSLESGYIRFAVKIIDDSELHVFEYVTSSLRKTPQGN